MEFYPAFLNLKNKRCIVIGGGKVAERKVISLLKAQADVCVVSMSITYNLKRLVDKNKIFYVNSEYKKKFLKNTFLIIAATNNSFLNSNIYREAVREKVLVNSVDSISESNFIVPAVLEKDNIVIAVSTSGKTPCLARRIKHDLKHIIDRKYIYSLRILEKVRGELKSKYSPNKRKQILNKLSNLSFSELKQNTFVKSVISGYNKRKK